VGAVSLYAKASRDRSLVAPTGPESIDAMVLCLVALATLAKYHYTCELGEIRHRSQFRSLLINYCSPPFEERISIPRFIRLGRRFAAPGTVINTVKSEYQGVLGCAEAHARRDVYFGAPAPPDRYLDEQICRYNARKEKDGSRFAAVLKRRWSSPHVRCAHRDGLHLAAEARPRSCASPTRTRPGADLRYQQPNRVKSFALVT
jgi:hypothetical protein